jgi:hypothetical protein
MGKISGTNVWRLLNCRFLKTGLKVCLFACVGDHRPCPRLHCLYYALWRQSEFTLICDGHEEYEWVSVPRLCRNDQFLGFVRGQTEQVEIWSLLRKPKPRGGLVGEEVWGRGSRRDRGISFASFALATGILVGIELGRGCFRRRVTSLALSVARWVSQFWWFVTESILKNVGSPPTPSINSSRRFVGSHMKRPTQACLDWSWRRASTG